MKFGIVYVYVLGLIVCARGFDYKADPEITKCLSVHGAKNFKEREITHHWRATHFSNPSYFFMNDSECLTIDIQTAENGIEVTFSLKLNNTLTNASDIQHRTKVPGIYNVDSREPSGITVYVPHKGYLLIYGCFHYLTEYEDFSLVLTKHDNPPDKVLEFFARHVKGKRAKSEPYFYEFPETNCT